MRCKKLQPIIPFKGNYEGENPYFTKNIYAFNTPIVSTNDTLSNEKVTEKLLAYNSITDDQKDTFERFGGILEEMNGYTVTQLFVHKITRLGEVDLFSLSIEDSKNLDFGYNANIDGEILNVYISQIGDLFFTFFVNISTDGGWNEWKRFIVLFELSERRISQLILKRLERYVSDNLKFKEILQEYQNLFIGSKNEFLDFLIYNDTLNGFDGMDFMRFFRVNLTYPNNLESVKLESLKTKLTKIKNQLNQEIDLVHKTPEPPQLQNENITQPLVKIRWNGNNNVLSDIFIQLKLMSNPKGEPLITNSDNDLAVFLKSNFTCFENTSLATIEKTLSNSKQGKRPHKDKRIDINRTDL